MYKGAVVRSAAVERNSTISLDVVINKYLGEYILIRLSNNQYYWVKLKSMIMMTVGYTYYNVNDNYGRICSVQIEFCIFISYFIYLFVYLFIYLFKCF